MMKNIVKILFIILIIMLSSNVNSAENNNSLDEYVSSLNKYTSNAGSSLNLFDIANNLKTGGAISHKNIILTILSIFFKQLRESINSALVIFFITIISSFVKAIQLDEKSQTVAMSSMVCFVAICIVLTSNLMTSLTSIKETCLNINNVMQIVSPFLMSLLVINGAITTVSIIEPLMLFISSFTGLVISNVIIPIILLSVVFSIIGSIGTNDGISKISKFMSKLALWILGILLTVFIGIMAMETSISKDVDSLAVKTTTSAISNFVPVVGKFFSDSFETVIGASKIISKTGGIIGIIAMILIVAVPLIKLIVINVIYTLLSAIASMIKCDQNIVKIIDSFLEVYRTMFGVLLANLAIFVISIGIMITIASNVIK